MSAQDSCRPSPQRKIPPTATPANMVHLKTRNALPDPFTGFIDSRPTDSDQFASGGLFTPEDSSAVGLDKVNFSLDRLFQFTSRQTMQATAGHPSMPGGSPNPFGLPTDPKDLTPETIITAMQEMSSRLKDIDSMFMRQPMETPQIQKKNRGRPPIIGLPLQVDNLDKHCSALFGEQFNPSSSQLNNLCFTLGPSFPGVAHELLLSSVRLWFRKKRERCGKKIFMACASILPGKFAEGLSLEDIKADIGRRGDLYAYIVRISRLGVFTDEAVTVAFIKSKVQAYCDRHFLGNTPHCNHDTGALDDGGDCIF